MDARSALGLALAVVLSAPSGRAVAQDDGSYSLGGPALAVGDPAPGLAVQEFVRGPAVMGFERGTVYVVEFWKVGCPPCRAAIPHLNDLQKKYPAVAFLSVGVYTSTADNIAYIKRTGDQIKYRVAVDRVPPGKDAYACGEMVQGWLEPAGESGVPTSFIIDGGGRIAWIGHPMDLDEVKAGRPLREIVAGTWDLKTAAAKFAESRGADARRRIDRLPKTERDAVHALHARAGRVEVVIRGNTVTWVRFDPRRVTDAVIADLATDLRKLNGLRRLDLCGADISDAGLKALRELTTVTTLDISCTRVTDAGLAHLRGWNDLQMLNLGRTQVTGVGVKELGAKPKLVNLDLSGLQITAAGLKSLKDFPELHVLNLSRTGLNDDRLGELRGMTELRGLDLSGNPITDAGLKALKGMTLGRLSLANTQVEGTGLSELRDLVGGLNLSGTRVTDAALVELKRFPELSRLVLDGTRVTDAGLAGLSQNRELRSLSLTDTQVTDAGLANLRDRTKLGTLELGGTGVTDGGLRELERLKALTFLDVARTKVTKAGVEGLRAALPSLQIAY
jgi:thiol-disulfide isomerase/thioredoxin/Leucine-rich repeat (LRR) protein